MKYGRIDCLAIALCFALGSLLAPALVYAASATLTMTPASTSVAIGSAATLDINVDSGGFKTIGTDVIVKYDPAKLDFVSITKGTVYSSYSTEVKDLTAGTVSLSGFVSASEISTGVAVKGIFAKVIFKGKAAGAATVSFDFAPGNSADSNVVEAGGSGGDILTSATGATITTGGGGTTPPPPPPPPPPPSGSTTPPPAALPDAADVYPTIAVVVLGVLFVLAGSWGISRSSRP